MKTSEINDVVNNALSKKQALIHQLRTYRLEPTGTMQIPIDDFDEILYGLYVRDLTSETQLQVGITVLHVKVVKETDFGLHGHEKQSQVIYVLKGKVYDLQSNIMFLPGQSFFVPKTNLHTVRYFPETEAVVVYMPKLSSH